MHLIAPLDKQFPILYGLLTDHIADDADYKVLANLPFRICSRFSLSAMLL